MTGRVLGRESAQVGRELADAARLAARSSWGEGARHLATVRRALAQADVRIAIVGEFKQGKSTLTNALLRTEVCPVDQDIVTDVPTVVRWGPRPRALAVVDGAAEEVAVPDIATWVGKPGTRPGLRAFEVELDRPLLRAGITLVDTPGVGGLDSAHGQLTRATVATADATVFVTDASQELTAPEMEFVGDAVERCRDVVVVMTKTDLYAEWPRILELDRDHLAAAGIDVPTFAVSSFLRLRAAALDDPVLNDRSGFLRLLDHLTGSVVPESDRLAATRATRELLFVTSRMAGHIAAEREVLVDRSSADAVVRDLASSSRRSRALADDGASWMIALQDGLNDLSSDLEHDLRQRLRRLQAEGEEALGSTDPARGWPEFEAWARKSAAAAAVAHLQVLVQRSEQLAADVAARFDLEQRDLDLDLPNSGESLRAISSLAVDFQQSKLRQTLGAMTAARVTYYGVVMTAAVVASGGAALLAPAIGLTVGAGAVFTRSLIREESGRQLDVRRSQARQAFRTYLDEVTFVLSKESRDAVRRTHRHLRDEFGQRARMVSRGSEVALAAARSAAATEDRDGRRAEVETRWRQLGSLTERLGRQAGAA
jgi:GTPase SAR1 family protein